MLVKRQREVERTVEREGVCPLNEYAEARGSRIHRRGVFATSPIKKGTYVIEYTGEKISKSESERRSQAHGVYLFDLNTRVDIDGAVGGNGAHLINHSCAPNADATLDDNRIMIEANRRIRHGEEISYDYGFDTEDYEDHPCRCGAKTCFGYIVDEKHRKRLGKRIKKR